MTIYQITVEKYNATAAEYWTNVYHANLTEGADGNPTLDAIVAAERALYVNSVIITKARIRVAAVGNRSKTKVYNQNGSKNPSGDMMPLFVVGRVDFEVEGSRPSRKYIRGSLEEAGVSFTTYPGGVQAQFQAYGDAIAAVPGICDPQGQLIVKAAASPVPGMRQLRRGSKKKSTP